MQIIESTSQMCTTFLTSLNCCILTIFPLESVGSRAIRKDAPAKMNKSKITVSHDYRNNEKILSQLSQFNTATI